MYVLTLYIYFARDGMSAFIYTTKIIVFVCLAVCLFGYLIMEL